MIGDKSFFPTKGTQQRSVLAPMIFNLYLDTIILNNVFLKEVAEKGKLIAYANDLFIIADNKTEAEECLLALADLTKFGLKINLKKTQIMTD